MEKGYDGTNLIQLVKMLLNFFSGLSCVREDLAKVIATKDTQVEEVYTNYGTHWGTRGVVLLMIIKQSIRFVT